MPLPPEKVGLSKQFSGCAGDLWDADPITKNSPKITPSQLEKRLDIIFRALINASDPAQLTRLLPIFIFGPPGIGKSQIVESLAKKYHVNVETYIASTMDPTQIQGMPYPNVQRKTTQWYPDERFMDEEKRTKVYFFDELNMAPSTTQSAFYRLILEGRLGSIDITHALRIGAGNRVSDFQGVTQMGLPLANRFEIYLIEPNIDDWIKWAKANNLNRYVIEYAEYARDTEPNPDYRYKPQRWYCINPTEPALGRATPRSWERVSKLINLGLDTKEDFIGSLGVAVGVVFNEWYRAKKEEEKGNKSASLEYDLGGNL